MALALSWQLTGRLARSAGRFTALDYPNARSLHHRPMPRTGGLAIVAGFLAAVVWLGLLGVVREEAGILGVRAVPWAVPWMVAMVGVIAIVSYLDDCGHVPAAVRLLTHFVAALGVVVGGDLRLTTLEVPGGGVVVLGAFATAVTILAVMWMTNLYNFMDGLDGLAGGMGVIGFSALAIIAVLEGHASLGVLSATVAAAAAGFLRYNFPPARIFMGDIGSISLGFLAASLSLIGIRAGAFEVGTPLLVFSPFIVDATVTLLWRIAHGRAPWRAHRDHVYQRLVLAGWHTRRTTLAAYGVMIVAGACAMLYQRAPAGSRAWLLLACAAVYSVLLLWARSVGHETVGGRTAAR